MHEGNIMSNWTRERIIRDIVRRDSDGLPISLSITNNGVEPCMYRAASRIFGSWKNAVMAAGLRGSRARFNRVWTPARIRKMIRSLSRRKQPLSTRELTERYGNFVTAARRHFGSWSKAVIASGIDPHRMTRTPAWSKERVIESILMMALRNEPLQRRFVQPRAFAEAGTRLFGSWKAALAAAGVYSRDANSSDTNEHLPNTEAAFEAVPTSTRADLTLVRHRPHTQWTDGQILDGLRQRFRDQQPLYATAVFNEQRALYRAATRRFGNWKNTLLAAGLEPKQHRKGANLMKDTVPSHHIGLIRTISRNVGR
jgi:hypothetical protein